MKITKLISKTFINALEGKPSSVLSSKHTIEWRPELFSYLIDGRILVPLHNIVEAEVELPEDTTVEFSKKLKNAKRT